MRTITNWRRAIDERGLTEEQRRQFCDDFLNFILDEWMPWHKEMHDFSQLEVNRLVLQQCNTLSCLHYLSRYTILLANCIDVHLCVYIYSV